MDTKVVKPNVKRRLRISDPGFTPPDGGWGWFIILACGFSNLSTFPIFQQFGLIFQDKFEELGITSAETTTIINLNCAFHSCVGLLNGPVFRFYSYRQVALSGAILVFVSLFITAFCNTFWSYLIIYSMLYGAGIGFTESANALALNTYFIKRRRIATGLSWSTTAMGPIVWPYIITALMSSYSTKGTLLFFAAFSGHAIMCALLLQPVHWHTEYVDINKEEKEALIDDPPYFNQEFGVTTSEIPGTNDGLYSQIGSSETSLTSLKLNIRFPSGINSQETSRRSSLSDDKKTGNKIIHIDVLEENIIIDAAQKLALDPSFFQKFCTFFDFNLLKDPKYLNLMIGITIANFAELNFAVLTPFVLQEFKFEKYQIATFMSLLGGTDILVRLIVPFLAEKIGWDNRIFFLIGVLTMAMGRVVLVHTQTYQISLIVAVIIGFGKGLRIIFTALVIPSYVPLERLPAASGLQLAISGILFLVLGPVVGWIHDVVADYVITLHILNIMTYITAISWTIEVLMSRRRKGQIDMFNM